MDRDVHIDVIAVHAYLRRKASWINQRNRIPANIGIRPMAAWARVEKFS